MPQSEGSGGACRARKRDRACVDPGGRGPL